jgi:hypothetical protein
MTSGTYEGTQTQPSVFSRPPRPPSFHTLPPMLRSVCAAAGAAGARALRRTAIPASAFGGPMSLGRAFHTSPVALDRILVGASSPFKKCDDESLMMFGL